MVSITLVTLTKHRLTTKEDMKASYKTPGNLSLSDDLENILYHYNNDNIENEAQVIFLSTMLSKLELKNTKTKNQSFYETFIFKNPDVSQDKMLASKSTSKFALWNGYRVTIPDVDFPDDNSSCMLPTSDYIFNQTKRFSIMMHEDRKGSLIDGRLDIFPIEDDEDDFMKMSDKELDAFMRWFVFLNHECVDFYNFTDFYHKTCEFDVDFCARLTGGEVKILSINEDYLELSNYRSYLPVDETDTLLFCLNHLVPNVPE